MHQHPVGSSARDPSSDGRAEPGSVRAAIARIALLVLAASALYQGLWAQFAPRSFFEDFPGGMGWVAGEGPYNQHLVRDIGGLVNGLAVMAIVAAWTLARPLLIANALGWLVYSLPHFGFHLSHPLDEPSMQAVNVAVLTSQVVLPLLGLLGFSARRADRQPATVRRAHPRATRAL